MHGCGGVWMGCMGVGGCGWGACVCSTLEIILNMLSHILLCKLCNICCNMLCCGLKSNVLHLYCTSHPFGSQTIAISNPYQSLGRDADPSPPSSAAGHEKVELYLYSSYGPYGLYRASVPVLGCTLPFYHTKAIQVGKVFTYEV